MTYRAEEAWFPLSEDILSWDNKFHDLMLNDELRMRAYEAAIKEVVRPGMIVVDLGTGTGVLALWALQAGAKMVYGIDVNEKPLKRAKKRIAEAGFVKKFEVFNALSYDVELPEKVDIIISEILGNLADNEDIVRILNDARLRFLKPKGIMLPASTQTYLVPVCSKKLHNQVQNKDIKSISGTYNFEKLIGQRRDGHPFNLYYDAIIPRSTHLAKPQSVCAFNFDGSDNPEYRVMLHFPIVRDGLFTGFKGYFTAHLSKSVSLNISGDDIDRKQTSDCLKHCYLPIKTPFQVKKKDIIALKYERLYPREKVNSPFRQCYRWNGSVIRGGIEVYTFHQQLC